MAKKKKDNIVWLESTKDNPQTFDFDEMVTLY